MTQSSGDHGERAKKVRSIFLQARDLTAADLSQYLDAACGSDAELRAEVESLLQVEVTQTHFLDDPAIGNLNLTDSDLPKRIGQFDILRKLGDGGFGDVYLGRRDDETQQRVAVKVIRKGKDSDEVLRRFEMERRVLARLRHPNIAHLIDTGTTDDGQPFFVMEYVDGLPIDQFCDEHKLSIHQRLKLFQRVCSAVQYAHSKFLLHRDLKPSNILVTLEGAKADQSGDVIAEEAIPKLLDFGIAKALSKDDWGGTITFEARQVGPLTPQYASPEQVRGEELDTKTDVYSLGVILYELVSGHKPYQILSTADLRRLVEIVEGAKVVRPSDMVAQTRTSSVGRTSGGAVSGVDAHHKQIVSTRSGSSRTLKRQLSGDIDNLVLYAMRKEADRRYSSVQQLNDDIEAVLNGEPLPTARPDSRTYVLRKFLRRNRGLVASVAAIFLILSTSLIMVSNLNLELKKQKTQLKEEKKQTKLVSDRYQSVARANDAFISVLERVILSFQGRDATVKELVDKLVQDVQQKTEGVDQSTPFDRRLDIPTLRICGLYYRAMGEFDLARTALEVADSEVGHFGEVAAEERGRIKIERAKLELNGKGDVFAAASLLKAAEELLLVTESPNLTDLSRQAIGLSFEAGDQEKAAKLIYRLFVKRRNDGAGTEELSSLINDYGYITMGIGDAESAEALLRITLEADRAQYSDTHPYVATSYCILGSTLFYQGFVNQSEKLINRGLELRREIYGHRNKDVANAILLLGHVSLNRLDIDSARRQYTEALEMQLAAKKNKEDLATAFSRACLANIYQLVGDLDSAVTEKEKAEQIYLEKTGQVSAFVPFVISYMPGIAMLNNERFAEAATYFERAIYEFTELKGAESAYVANAKIGLSRSMSSLGQKDDALEEASEALNILRTLFGEEHPMVATGLANLAEIHETSGNLAKALELLEAARQIRQDALPQPNCLSLLTELDLLRIKKSLTPTLDVEGQKLDIREKLKQIMGPDDPRLEKTD